MNYSAEEGQCSFFLKKKNRFCRFRPNKDHKYCAEHSMSMGVELERKRVVCPLNPSHTCYEDSLKIHLKKCNNRKKAEEEYYVEAINAGSEVDEDKLSINDVLDSELKVLIGKINKLYDEYINCIEEDILTHVCMKEELQNDTYGTSAMRHRKQQASLVGHMEKLGLLQDNTRYIEMGAGKGQLSHWVQRAVQGNKNIAFLLVDRGSARYKFDCYHKSEEDGPQFERLKIDIEHLDLDKVKSINICDNKELVAIGKHLCGAATDLALRCLVRKTTDDSESHAKRIKTDENVDNMSSTSTNRALKGLVIALCCHHRCTWKSYVGKTFLKSNGIKAHEFNQMLSISSWATCAWKGWKAEERGESEKLDRVGEDEEENNHEQIAEEYRGSMKLNKEERENVGRKCKRLIDYGRVQYLMNNNMKAGLKSYINSNLTPENIVLLATNQTQ